MQRWQLSERLVSAQEGDFFFYFFHLWPYQNGRENLQEVCNGCQPAMCLFYCLEMFTDSAGLIQTANITKNCTIRQFCFTGVRLLYFLKGIESSDFHGFLTIRIFSPFPFSKYAFIQVVRSSLKHITTHSHLCKSLYG